jgi:hypothetical protein
LNVNGFNLRDLKNKCVGIDTAIVRDKFLEKEYIDDSGNFRIEKFRELLEYKDPNKEMQQYLNYFGKIINDLFTKFQDINVFPIIYHNGVHKFIETVLSVLKKDKGYQL